MTGVSGSRLLVYDLDLPALCRWMQDRGQPDYRARQVFGWLYQRFALSFEAMTDLPGSLRQALLQELLLPGCRVVAERQGQDTEKLLLEYEDGAQAECVSIATEGLPTFCLSTQVGCAMGCAFCASTLQGCERNLTTGEILVQATSLAARYGRPGNVVFMGMGEPLLNLGNVVAAVQRLTDPQAFGLSPRRITIPTVGIVPQIRRLGEMNLGVNLAISLNSTRDDQRRELMPAAARWNLRQLLAAAADFSRLTGGQPVTFAYVLLRGVNDFPADADRLVDMLRPLRHHLNLIPFNPVEHALLQPPTERHVQEFARRLRQRGLNVSIRRSKGTDIEAACGQLRRRAGKEKEPPRGAAAQVSTGCRARNRT